jgi:hypothetical protein
MKETVTIEDLQEMQMEITKALQQQVLSNLGVKYQPYLEAVGFSVDLLGRLRSIGREPDEDRRGMATMSRCY